MSRHSRSVPNCRHHKPSGKAVVTINGRDIYLGVFGSKESRDTYGWLMPNSAAMD